MAMRHLEDDYLYRILYYDCNPILKKAHNPISNKAVDFSKSKLALFRAELFNELKKKKKSSYKVWRIKRIGQLVN